MGQNLGNIQKEPKQPEVYRGLDRAVQSFIARARNGHLVTQLYLNRSNLAIFQIAKFVNQQKKIHIVSE